MADLNFTPVVERPLIVARGLTVDYGLKQVLRDLDINVAAGECLSIVGRSGCGKTTLLMAIAGFIPHGGNVCAPPRLGVVFQSYAIYPWLTVRGNISFGLQHLEKVKREERVASYLAVTGLAEHADKYPAQLSGGQAQRVGIARTLAADPDVLLLDEPLGALDLITRDEMASWLQHLLVTAGKTVVQVTHSIEEAIWLSSRILVMGTGRFVAEYSVPFPRPRVEALKFTEEFNELKQQIHEALKRAL